MGFCTSCGAALLEGAAFCPSCGATVLGVAAPAPQPPRPVGAHREPWRVVLLSIATLGVYSVVWWWKVSKEVDAFTGRPGHAHGRIRVAAWLDGIGLVLGCVALAAFFSALAGMARDPPPPGDVPSEAIALGVLLVGALMASALLGIAGLAFLYWGAWRVWEAIRDDEARRRVPAPLSPAIMLLLAVIPYVNLVTTWIMVWRTQQGLNGVWAAQGPRG